MSFLGGAFPSRPLCKHCYDRERVMSSAYGGGKAAASLASITFARSSQRGSNAIALASLSSASGASPLSSAARACSVALSDRRGIGVSVPAIAIISSPIPWSEMESADIHEKAVSKRSNVPSAATVHADCIDRTGLLRSGVHRSEPKREPIENSVSDCRRFGGFAPKEVGCRSRF